MLSPGTRLGPYEIRSPLGAGGMGEVYRARDTRLERSVALKVLPQHRSATAEMRARFEREARAISALSHPHICALFDVGSEQGNDYLVMELIEGETLAQRLERGALPLAEMLRIGAELGEALAYAHRKGIIHRDLKPGNVMLTRTGAKLLDFGLAKPQGTPAPELAQPLTQEGIAVGTPQYMAPEALRGEPLDSRADVFALGALVYEMATGRRAFGAASQGEAIALILASQPARDAALSTLAPPALDRLVRRCLASDPELRWQDAGDLAIELCWIGEGRPDEAVTAGRGREPLFLALGLLGLALAAAAWFRAPDRAAAPQARETRLAFVPPPELQIVYCHQAALSPDGRQLVCVGFHADGTAMLLLRALDSAAVQVLPGTEGASLPFWSPDGRSLAFFAHGKLERLDLSGGAPRTIVASVDASGGSWGASDVIVLGGAFEKPLARVPATGGTPEPITTLGPKDEAHRWPSFLPDGRRVLFMVDAWEAENHHLRILDLSDGKVSELCTAVSNGVIDGDGELLCVRGGKLLAQACDLERGVLRGEPRVLAEDIASCEDNHRFEFTAARADVVVCRSKKRSAQFVWCDRSGKLGTGLGESRNYADFALSPDGRRIAFAELDADGRTSDLWLMDAERGTVARLTNDQLGDDQPRWSPDGHHLAFVANRRQPVAVVIHDVDDPSFERVWPCPDDIGLGSWFADGARLLVETKGDLCTFDTQSGKLEPLLKTGFRERAGCVSGDGRLLAYASNESGPLQVELRALPISNARLVVSADAAIDPQWSRDGRELFFRNLPGDWLFAAAIHGGEPPEAGAARALFRVPGLGGYAPAPDAQRFLLLVEPENPPLTVLLGSAAARAH